LLITAAHSPDRARITLQLRRYRLNPFACCDRQHEPCMQDLITRVGFGYVPFAATGAYRPAQFAVLEVCDHA
jgi:hypothetical protein